MGTLVLLMRAVAILETERDKLLQWAKESKTGGWSIHQVEPMIKRAAYLNKQIADLERDISFL